MKRVTYIFICALLLECGGCASLKSGDERIEQIQIAFLQGAYEKVINLGETMPANRYNIRRYDRTFYYIALSYLVEGQYEEARSYLTLLKEKGKRIDFTDEVDMKIADSYFAEGNYEQALLLYQKFLGTYPTSLFLPSVYFNMGEAAQKLGRFYQAKGYFSNLQRLYPLSFEAKRLDETEEMQVKEFSVQVGSFFDQENAEHQIEELREQGYRGTILNTEKDGATYYRVRVGTFKTKNEAEALAQELTEHGFTTKIYP